MYPEAIVHYSCMDFYVPQVRTVWNRLYSRGNLRMRGRAEGLKLVRKLLWPCYISLLFKYFIYINYIDMKKHQTILGALALLLVFALFHNEFQSTLSLETDLTVDQQLKALPAKIIAGEVHFSRIPFQYWEHRLQMIKAMGINALSVYVMWNYHETARGHFDYTTPNKNLTRFLELAKRYELYVLIRPGPYACAEWDFGGFPARLLNINGIKLRANNKIYLDEVRLYFQSLASVLQPFLAKNGGPIILLQIQNQYGFYGSDKSYIEALRLMWKELGVDVDQFYVDIAQNLLKCHWNGANIGINDGITEDQYDYAKTIERTGFIFGGQIYSGWLTHWGEQFQGKTLEKYNEQFNFLFNKNHSFSMYMVHGGTNFGLTAGANSYDDIFDYRGHITSYDYDSPIDEQGSPNLKFTAFRDLAKKFVPWPVPDPPQPIKAITIPPFKPTKVANLFSNLPNPSFTKSTTAYLFQSNELQMYNQGFVLYETLLSKDVHYLTVIVHDYAIVTLNGNFFEVLDRSKSTKHSLQVNCTSGPCSFQILVEAMGHINFDHAMETDRKGLFFINDTRSTKFEWKIYKINVDENILNWKLNTGSLNSPALFKATFSVSEVGDTFINLSNYKKGYVWVNGRNLGRYWNIGPSQKLFCPGVWLKAGQNEIYILDLLTDAIGSISGDKTLK